MQSVKFMESGFGGQRVTGKGIQSVKDLHVRVISENKVLFGVVRMILAFFSVYF